MTKGGELVSTFRPTERRKFQFDELDATIALLHNTLPTDPLFLELSRRVDHLKLTISLHGPDVGEFES